MQSMHDVAITDMPVEFCAARCNAWNRKLERCNARRWSTECGHPEREEAWKYREQKGSKR